MKRILTLILILIAGSAWAIPPSPPFSIATHNTDATAHPGYIKIEKTITNPNDADVWYIGHNPLNSAWTISEIRASAIGGTSVVLTVQECDANCANCAAVMSALTVTTGTTVTGTLTDTSIADNACIAIDIGTVTGAVTQAVVTIK